MSLIIENGTPLNQVKDIQTVIILYGPQEQTEIHIETSWVSAGPRGQLFSSLLFKPAVRGQWKRALKELDIQAGKKGES